MLPERDWSGDDFEWSQSVSDLLHGTFGVKTWRTNQKEIVNATLSGRDVFVVMRTGGGKSLCYQLPALLKGGITIGACWLLDNGCIGNFIVMIWQFDTVIYSTR